MTIPRITQEGACIALEDLWKFGYGPWLFDGLPTTRELYVMWYFFVANHDKRYWD